MDYHFVKPKIEENSSHVSFSSSKISRLLKSFLPVIMLAAALPFFIGLVVAPPDIGFLTRADSASELRIWVDPANAIMSPGSQATFTVFASFDSESKLIPEISFDISSSQNISIEEQSIVHRIPFKGKTEIGKITVTALQPGNAEIIVLENSIEITALDSPLEITTSSANLVVR